MKPALALPILALCAACGAPEPPPFAERLGGIAVGQERTGAFRIALANGLDLRSTWDVSYQWFTKGPGRDGSVMITLRDDRVTAVEWSTLVPSRPRDRAARLRDSLIGLFEGRYPRYHSLRGRAWIVESDRDTVVAFVRQERWVNSGSPTEELDERKSHTSVAAFGAITLWEQMLRRKWMPPTIVALTVMKLDSTNYAQRPPDFVAEPMRCGYGMLELNSRKMPP